MKKIVALLLCAIMLAGIMPAAVFAEEVKPPKLSESEYSNEVFKDGYTYYVLTPEQITKGGWIVSTSASTESVRGSIMESKAASDATVKFVVPKDDIYTVFVHSRSYSTHRPFDVFVDDKHIGTPGTHGTDGWNWQRFEQVVLTSGEHTMRFNDRENQYRRFDLVLVTNDPAFYPDNTIDSLTKLEENHLYDASKIEVIPSNPTEGRPDTEIAIKFNGNWMSFDVDPVIINSRTMVPLRAIFEALGATVSWDDETATAKATRNGKSVSVTIGSNLAIVDGESVTIDQSASLINGRTMVPLRFVSEAFGADVQWLGDSQSVIINAIIPAPAFYITADSYYTYGSWEMQSQKGAAVEGAGVLIGLTKYAKDIKPAIAQLKVEKEGDYRIWVRARDFATNQPGTRFFDVKVNGGPTGRTYGQHGKDGFRWEDGGIVHLNEGINTIEVHDSSAFYARLAGIFLTQDVNGAPPSFDYQEVIKKASPWNALASISEELFPAWAKQETEPFETATIESATSKVNFYKINDANRGTIVQNEIFTKDANGQWVMVKARTDEFGYLAIRSDYSTLADSVDEYVNTEVKFNRDGVEYLSVTRNLYKMGDSEWLIPNGWNILDNNKIQLTFAETPNLNFTATWEMDEIQDDPKVTISADIKNNGYYSFVMSNGKEHSKESLEAVTIPYRITEKRISQEPGVVIETQLTAPLGLITVKDNGVLLTQGIAADASAVSDGEWVWDNTSEFGIGGIGVSGGYKATLAAPLMGSSYSNLSAGQNYTFAYRVVNKLDDWHETYMHVAEDIMNVHDYRNNYYQNTNDTIFNITDLMMDDLYGGWDEYGKGHWNMEGQGVSTIIPLVAVQRYMLTEDDALLTERVIPTMAALLTRTQRNFKRSTSTGGAEHYIKGDSRVTAIGTPTSEYIANTFYGWYLMSNGNTPAFNAIAEGRAKNDSYDVADFEKVLSAITIYKQTGKQEDLDVAIAAGDVYLANTLGNEAYMNDVMRWSGFVNQYYYPNIGTFIDLYELSGEQRFLDAAQESANILTTTLDTYGLTGDLINTDRVLTREEINKQVPSVDAASGYYWHGEVQWRVGWPYGEIGPMTQAPSKIPETQTVPGWLPVTAGLGIENATSYDGGECINLSTWVGDLNRLAYYTGEDFYNICARNSIVGRSNNYPGYYFRTYMAHYMDEKYPYEGPDYTNIFWHHIPITLGQLEEFLISDAFYQSGSKIEFPHVRQTGYAYFYSNHYGFQPGKMYDVDGLWLWNDRGIVSPDSKQLDYLPAKKDGTLAVAFMNRDAVNTTSTITLGEKIEKGATYTGTATLYDAAGNKSTVEVVNGQFTITVPAKGMMTVIMNNIGVKSPAFADESFKVSDLEVGATVSDHARGRGYALQLTPDKYFAYIYVTDTDAAVYDGQDTTKQYSKSITVTYTVNGKTEKVVRDTYPFEVIIPVDDVNAEIQYSVSAVRADNSVEELGSGVLMTAKKSKELGKVYKGQVYNTKTPEAIVFNGEPHPNLPEFTSFVAKYNNQGIGGGNLRFAVAKDQLPFDCTETDLLKNCVVKLKGTELATGKVEESITYIAGNEASGNNIILKIKPTDVYPAGSYDNAKTKTHTFEITVYKPGTALVPAPVYYVDPIEGAESAKPTESAMPEDFAPFSPAYQNIGTKNNLFRFGTSAADYPFEISADTLKGAKVKLVATAIDGGDDFTVETVLAGNEVSGSKVILLVAPTEVMPYRNYLATHKFEITISQPDK